jgi:hypothetical protein
MGPVWTGDGMFGHQQLKLSEKENNPLAERTIVRTPDRSHCTFPEATLLSLNPTG